MQRGDLVAVSLQGDDGKTCIKISKPFGRLANDRMRAVDKALLLVVGLI
jgi:hypothetical protein